MPLLDSAINFISPKWAAERAAWRAYGSNIEASYKGGSPTRLSESWELSQGYRFGTSQERKQIVDARSRAYNAYENNPVARALVDTETDNVIGDGLNYQPTSDSEEWNREAEDRYYQWLEVCSVRGSDIHPGCEIQRLLWSQSRIAGDIGWILVSRGDDSRIQIVPAENICTPDGRYGDKNIYDGIRYDSFGAPTEFFVLSHSEVSAKREFIPIPSRDFVYLPHMVKSSQARPQTCYMTIFDLLAHLDRYVDGVSLAAWMGTVIGLVFKQTNAAQQFGQLPMATNSRGDQQKAVTLENGMLKFIGTDEEVVQVQSHQPMQQTPDFIRAMYRMLGQPFRMPLEVIAMDMSSCNFASARIGLLPFYRNCRIKAGQFGSRWSRTIRWWLSRERLRPSGDRDKWKSAWPANYWNHELVPNAWEYTDPVSEAQADLLQADMGTKSIPMIIRERGRNADRILTERREYVKSTSDMPLINSTLTRHPQSGVGAMGDPLGKEQVGPPNPAQPNEDTNNGNDSGTT